MPPILVLGDNIIERTSFELNRINLSPKSYTGTVRVHGYLRGKVNGTLEGTFSGVIKGDMEATVTSGKAVLLEAADQEGEQQDE